MDIQPEQIASQLINRLETRLREFEDAENAISVYKIANWIISQLEDVKKMAVDLAEQDLRLHSKKNARTVTGSAGWTEPKALVLDEQAWREAMAEHPELMQIQREYDVAEARLRQAQEPYLRLPESTFFIR